MEREELISLLQRRDAEGKTLSLRRITDEKYPTTTLQYYANQYYGSWTEAKSEILGESASYRRLPRSKQEVVEELSKMRSEGCSMKVTDIASDLYSDIKLHFGGYMQAKAFMKLELKYERDDVWTSEKLLEELKLALPEISTKTDYNTKYKHIGDRSFRIYGDRYEVFRLIGSAIPPRKKSKYTKPKRWTEKAVAEELRNIFDEYGVKSAHWLINNGHRKLVNGVKRVYGTWNAGLIANGYEVAYESPKKDWTQDYAKEAVINALINGTEPTLTALRLQIRGLGSYLTKKYNGGISEFFAEIGICPLTDRPKPEVSRVYRPSYTTLEGLQREILRLWYVGCPLNYNFIRKHRTNLIQRANEHIGSWRKAVESVGIEYGSITKSSDSNVLSECGTEFELLFSALLDDLGYEFIREGNEIRDVMQDFTIKPDFILPNGRFIDCKLSEWTDASEMLKKYQQYQPNGITIVYLRGKNRRVERGRKWKYEHVSVYQFTKDLPDERRAYYETKFNEIARRADEGAIAR